MIVKGHKQSLQDSICFPQHLVIPKPNNPYARSLQKSCPHLIPLALTRLTMLSAIQLHAHASLMTVKIQHIDPDLILAAEFESTTLSIS